MDRRDLIVTIFLCAALFVGSFAIGRAASPRSGQRAPAPPSLRVAFAGAAVPFRLSSAPPIRMRKSRARARALDMRPQSGQPVVVGSARASSPALSEATPPGVQTPVREVARVPHTAAGAAAGAGQCARWRRRGIEAAHELGRRRLV